MEDPKIDSESLVITPLERSMVKRAFAITEPEAQNLIDWFKTAAIISQEERKCKVYVALKDKTVIGYVALSMSLPDAHIEGLSNHSSHAPQMILVGKLYVLPECRSMGVGTELMQLAVGMAIKLDEMVGCIGIIVDANSNPRTVKFYERFGFEVVSRSARTVKMFFKLPAQPIVHPERALPKK